MPGTMTPPADVLSLAVGLLAKDPGGGPDREIGPDSLEVAVLDRNRPRRTFRRVQGRLLAALLSSTDPLRDVPEDDEPTDERPDQPAN